jgi:hypothetical protein
VIKFESLDNLTQTLNCHEQVKLIKVDTEGYDMRIIRGASEILASAKPVLSFELNRENIFPLGDSVVDFFDFLSQMGFTNFLVADPNGKPVCTLRADDRHMVSSLYQYSGPHRPICYFDIWAFHKADEDLFAMFLKNQEVAQE